LQTHALAKFGWLLNFHKYIHVDNVNPDLFELVASDMGSVELVRRA
jgi:hypothetical protein